MSFAFKRKESVVLSVRRIGIASAGKGLKNCGKDAAESIHIARKEIKKMRAVLRLIKKELPKDTWESQTGALREAAAQLAPARDAHVKCKSLEALGGNVKRRNSKDRIGRLRAVLQEESQKENARFRDSGAKAKVRTILREQGRQFKGLKVKNKGWSAIGPGLKKSYRAAREARDAAKADPVAENFHEWRKKVKNLWYDVLLLSPVWPEQMRALADDLEKLGEFLGDDHDLQILRQTAIKKSVDVDLEPEANYAISAADARSQQLRSAASKAGTRLFEEKPGDFCARIHRYWKNWKSQGKNWQRLRSAAA